MVFAEIRINNLASTQQSAYDIQILRHSHTYECIGDRFPSLLSIHVPQTSCPIFLAACLLRMPEFPPTTTMFALEFLSATGYCAEPTEVITLADLRRLRALASISLRQSFAYLSELVLHLLAVSSRLLPRWSS